MNLPIYKDDNQPFQLMQSRWASILNPIISNFEVSNQNPLINGKFVSSVTLNRGENTFSHFLGRKPVGWLATDINGASILFRSQQFNDQTISITSSMVAANLVASFWVF